MTTIGPGNGKRATLRSQVRTSLIRFLLTGQPHLSQTSRLMRDVKTRKDMKRFSEQSGQQLKAAKSMTAKATLTSGLGSIYWSTMDRWWMQVNQVTMQVERLWCVVRRSKPRVQSCKQRSTGEQSVASWLRQILLFSHGPKSAMTGKSCARMAHRLVQWIPAQKIRCVLKKVRQLYVQSQMWNSYCMREQAILITKLCNSMICGI